MFLRTEKSSIAALVLAVLGQQDDPAPQRVPRGERMRTFFPAHQDVGSRRARSAPKIIRTSSVRLGADQAREAEHLALRAARS